MIRMGVWSVYIAKEFVHFYYKHRFHECSHQFQKIRAEYSKRPLQLAFQNENDSLSQAMRSADFC